MSDELKVIGAGFGRTGTTSLRAALETLGFAPCYHMIETFRRPEHAKAWHAAWRGEAADWDALLGGFQATVDWPGCTFYRDLMERYPNAKVLLSVRDPGRWYESSRGTIYELTATASRSPVSRLLFGLMSLLVFGAFSRGNPVWEIIWRGTFDGRFEDRAHATGVFERHNEEVKHRVPPEKLLIYDVREGWGPLCTFLGVDEPDEPFPHLNDAAQMQRGILALRVLSWVAPTAFVLLAVVLFVLVERRIRA